MNKYNLHSSKVKKIIITGGTGYLGKELVKILALENNYQIKILTRNPKFEVEKFNNVELYIGDLLDINSLTNLLEVDSIVINLAYISGINANQNIVAINNLLDACTKAKIRKLLHCSTAVVVGNCSKKIITEEEADNPISEYAKIKLSIEKLIKTRNTRNFEAIILRPTAIFGDNSLNLRKLSEDILNNRIIINYMRLCLYNYRRLNLVHIFNVVEAFKYMIEEKKCYNNEVFLLSDSESKYNNFFQVHNFIVKKTGVTNFYRFFIPIPLKILKVLLGYKKADFNSPLSDFSSEKIKSIGYKKTITFEEGLINYVKSLRKKNIC